ncbi:MAG: hypothetical protein E7514_02750 [Ruminococcaceae bacterium]|nr:hypothetical protein [Oscillospiraceae bacterium]
MEYWYLWLIFAVLVIVTAVVIVFASRAVSSHNAETRRMYAEIDRLKKLKDKYKNLDRDLALSSEPAELLEGVNAVLQAKIEGAENAEAEFDTFGEEAKNLYTLKYFLEDSSRALSFFFKNNGAVLTKRAVPSLEAIGYTDILDTVKRQSEMYDSDNEDVSLDYKEAENLDNEFRIRFSETEFLNSVKQYICQCTDRLF